MNSKKLNNIQKAINFKKYVKLIEKAIESDDLIELKLNLINAIEIEPKNFALLNELGNALRKLSDHEQALIYYRRALDENENNALILGNIGATYMHLENFTESESYLKKAIEIDPNSYHAFVNLTALYNNMAQHGLAAELCIKSIAIFPSEFHLHFNLSVALVGLGLYQEALYSAETAKQLDRKSIDIDILIASIDKLMGKYDDSYKFYKNFLDDIKLINHPKRDLVKWSMADILLRRGQIEQGWQFYKYGFSKSIPTYQRRMPSRTFLVPEWSGEKIEAEQVLLVWAEQGLGDELLFMTIIQDMIKDKMNIIIECDVRLVSIIQRSFPSIKVRPTLFNVSNASIQIHSDFNLHIPMGNLPAIYRKDIKSFINKSPKLLTDRYLDNKYAERLAKYSGTKKVGICWRSGKLDAERNKEYTLLTEWTDIFSILGITFVNLQYGDCEEELKEAEQKFGVAIVRWPDLDLKNNLEETFALINQLDFVVSAGTAVACMSYSIAKPTITFSSGKGWPNLGTDYFPWAECVKPFFAEPGNATSSTLKPISDYIKSNML